MRNRILSTGLLMTALIVLIFLSYRAVAEPDAQGGATTGEISPIAEPHAKMPDVRKARRLLERIAEATHRSDDITQRTKVAAGANANTRLSLDLIANGGSGNRRNDGVTSGTVSGRGTKIAIEIFATGVTTPLIGMQLRFDFDSSLVTFVKAENSAFALNLPSPPTGTDFAATSPVTLPSSNFLARAEFTTASDVTDREFSIGIASVVLSESQSSSDRLITRNRISFNVPTTLTPDFDGDGMVGFSDFLAFAGRYGTRRGDGRYQAKYDLNRDGAIDFSDFLSFAGSYGKPPPNSGGSSPDGEQRGGTPKMYWVDTGKIQRANLDGSNVEDLITTGLSAPDGIALDVERGKMYWTDWIADKIQRANLDGSNVEDLITTGSYGLRGIALDVERGKMYWTDWYTAKIQRANLNGSNVEDLITTGLKSLDGIALDVERGKMYWTDYGTNKIQRANLDGSNVEDLITTGLRLPRGIALDVERGKMYWTDYSTNKIQRVPTSMAQMLKTSSPQD